MRTSAIIRRPGASSSGGQFGSERTIGKNSDGPGHFGGVVFLDKMLAGKLNLVLVGPPPTLVTLALGQPCALANKHEQFGH